MWLFHALLCTTSLASLVAFNVDLAQTWLTPKDISVVLSSLLHQDSTTNQTWLLVTSPRTNRTSKLLHQCFLDQDEIHCRSVEHGRIPKGRHRGVTVVQSQHGVLLCTQVLSRLPNSLTSELTGTCSLLDPDLHLQAQINFSNLENLLNSNVSLAAGKCYRNKIGGTENTARWRRALTAEEEEEEEEEVEEEEEEAGTEIAIILDGSGSIEAEDFQIAKDFISNMMRNFSDKCFECRFALVQYGDVIQTEFDLEYSQNMAAALDKVQNITQVKSVTKTASAMQHVLDNIFTSSGGSRRKALKVMVVLTDGDIFGDDLNLTTVINSPKMKGIERFAIGVGEVFKKERTYSELKLIASDPDETHAFKVTNYKALDRLLGKLQQKIISTEGAAGDALHYQLAQIGFSAQFLDEGQVLLGGVGAFNWSGGVLLYDFNSCSGQFLNQTETHNSTHSYLGYAVAVIHKAGGLSYVAGAPRHRHRGAVFELQKDSGDNFKLVLEGEQMGSYFGSELCPVDINMNGNTDFLLVAAPFYHIHREEGRVYVYQLNQQNDSFSLVSTLCGHPGFAIARFGFAIATVGDINQDKLTDVAIGAPLEGLGSDDGASFGSVYIYNGHRDGFSTSPSQRIRASTVAPGLHFFGVSIAGGLDFSGDGLADITVGTVGQAVVFRSKPVVYLNVSMFFTPQALPLGFDSSINVKLCFETSSATTAAKSDFRFTALNFTVDVDLGQERKRLQCSDKRTCQNSFREWSSSPQLCASFLLVPTEGELLEEDRFSNISINVSYQLQTPEDWRDHPHPVLDFYTKPFTTFQLPFEKDCKNKLFCVAELQLATTISQEDLVVGFTKELDMNITLTNSGEDSYLTNMTLNYPRNLHFKRMQKFLSPDIQCEHPKPTASDMVMNCMIGHPVFKKSSAEVLVVWQLEEHAFPNKTANITVTITNSNERKSLTRKHHTLRFKHAFIAVLPKHSVMYIKTNQGFSEHKEFLFDIHGENIFGAEFQLQVCVPTKLRNFEVMKVKKVTKIQDTTVCTEGAKNACGSERVLHVNEWHSVTCTITADKENVTVAAEIFLSRLQHQQLKTQVTELQVLGEISFNTLLYEGLNAENKTKISVIFLQGEVFFPLPLVIGSSVSGLLVLVLIIVILFKCGFFKRRYHQLNLDSIRKNQLASEPPYEDNEKDEHPHSPEEKSITRPTNL